MASSGLPASRTDALSVVVLGLFSAFIGATPADGKKIALLVSTLANMWAIVSSVVTLVDIVENPHGIEEHLWFFLLGLLILTIVTSVLALLSFKVQEVGDGMPYALLVGVLVALVVFVFGLVELLLTYTHGCDSPSFASTALCKHSTGYVVATVVGVGVCGLVLGWVITQFSSDSSSGTCQNVLGVMDFSRYSIMEEKPLTTFGAIVTRMSALVKALLLGIYWFLVDGDLSWGSTVQDQDTSWWITGQWAKQGAAIANSFLNCLI